MKRDTKLWLSLMVIGGLCLLGRALFSEQGMARVYVRHVEVNASNPDPAQRWMTYQTVDPKVFAEAQAADPQQTEVSLSLPRSIGVWLAALFTLAIFSFLYRDNPLYKLAEAVVVGASAAYWMVVGFWSVLVPNLLARLWPEPIHAWAMPGLDTTGYQDPLYFVPLVLGVLLLWRLMPAGGWIARWPLAFIVGTFCGLRLVGFLHADFLSQIRNSIVPLAVMDGGALDLASTVGNVVMVIGVLSCLVYFFFSFEHKGVVGGTARLGMQFLMVTFGAAFGFTVMGRIALLAIRLEFLFDDWLWLIDPVGRRLGL